MRLINADALYRRIKTECNPYGRPTIDFESGKKVLDIIDNAPTVELFCSYLSDEEVKQPCIEGPCNHERPQGEWIPVSERLPEFSGLYLISIDSLVTVMNFSGTHFTNRWGVRNEVDAWQPLPEPYKKESDNEE